MDLIPSREFHIIFNRIFNLSKYLGVFPLRVNGGEIDKSYWYLIGSICSMVPIVYFSLQHLDDHLHKMFNTQLQSILTKALGILYVGIISMPPVSSVWLAMNTRKFSMILKYLLDVENASSYVPEKINFPIVFLLFVAQLICNIYRCYLKGITYLMNPMVWLVQIFMALSILITLQFTLFVKIISSHYQHLLNTVNKINAEKWTECHEILGTCCDAISECYGPQLVIFFLSMFVINVCYGFLIVDRLRNQNFLEVVFGIFWASFYSFNILYILHSCRGALVKARKFNKQLYYMVLNDDTKVLLRNKRIQSHFKEKRTEEFSAMGFFKLDYPLICSMVYSATTYVVILVQFSK